MWDREEEKKEDKCREKALLEKIYIYLENDVTFSLDKVPPTLSSR